MSGGGRRAGVGARAGGPELSLLAQAALVGGALALAACGGAGPGQAQEASAPRSSARRVGAFDYRFTLSEDLGTLDAEICFPEGGAPASLTPLHRDGLRYLRSPSLSLPGAAPRPLTAGPQQIELSHLGPLPPAACLRYRVDLEASANSDAFFSFNIARRVGRDMVASTGVWLWAPWPREPEARITARFTLPEGISVAPIWIRETVGGEEGFRLDERAFHFLSYAAFGRFSPQEVPVPGGCLSVSVLDGPSALSPEELGACVGTSARAVSQIFGRFPSERASVLLVPAGPSLDPAPFGIVGRGVIPTAAILFSSVTTRAELEQAWVPAHELSHMATPFIAREDAWLSEGVATYYQEVLRARAGLIEPEEAWTHLVDGFERGAAQGTGRSLREESEQMHATRAYQRVYWAGAAIALLADVAMRRAAAEGGASEGTFASLDAALEHLDERCGQMNRSITADEAMARFDERGDPIFSRVAMPLLASSDFPSLTEVSAYLGLRGPSDALRIDEGAPGAAVRRAIMAPRPSLAPPRCAPAPPE